MGRLIPAGTGMSRYLNIGIQVEAPEGGVQPGEVASLDLSARLAAPPEPPVSPEESPL